MRARDTEDVSIADDAAPSVSARPASETGGSPAPDALEIHGMSKAFGSETVALDHLTLTIKKGEFFTIIGPSGSGKTTLLRIIGGFERPDSFETFRLAGRDIDDVPAHRRNVATVFQHYALFPHMTVGRNVEYGLKLRGVPGAERKRRALEALQTTGLPKMYERTVGNLSGGERQRVALARVIVIEPTLLLLDEPLGALDEKLRATMQFELKQLQRSLGITFVYITHNQDEALTMSDRLAVLHGGVLQQLGTPKEVYERPRNRFVAEFMGVANLVPGDWLGQDAGGVAEMSFGASTLKGIYTGDGAPTPGQAVYLSVRPEHLTMVDSTGNNPLAGVVTKTAYRGSSVETVVQIQDGLELTVRQNPSVTGRRVGDSVELRIDPATSIVFCR